MTVDYLIEGPTTFEVERGGYIFGNVIKEIWLFNALNKNLTLYYDAKTSLLLKATYTGQDLGDPIVYGMDILLTESSC